MAVVCSDNTEELLGEYNEVLNSLSDDSMTEMYLLGQKEVNPEVYWNILPNKLHFFDEETTQSIGYPMELY